MTLIAVPLFDIFLWLYLQIQVYQTSGPDMHVLLTQITHLTKQATSHMLERTWTETEYRLHVLLRTKGQKSEVLILKFVPKSIEYNKFYQLPFNNLNYASFCFTAN
jgi:hypothetical protein